MISANQPFNTNFSATSAEERWRQNNLFHFEDHKPYLGWHHIAAQTWNHIWLWKDSNRQGSHYNLQSIYIYIKLTHGTCLFQDAPTTCYFCSRVKSYNNRPTKTTAKNTCNNGSPTKSTCFWAVELPYSPKTVRSALAKLRCAFSISSRTMTSFPQQISYPSTTSWAKRGIW